MDWKAKEKEILSSLDILAEAQALGLKASSDANGKAWVSCYAIDRNDKSPSAAICVKGDQTGRYKDSGSGQRSISWFEFAARNGPWKDWKDARAHFAEQTGISLREEGVPRPSKIDETQMAWKRWSPSAARIWCQKFKRGISVKALQAFGARMCRWPAKGTAWLCLAFPSYDIGGEIASWTLYRTDGEQFPAFGHLHARKTHNVKGSRPGLSYADLGALYKAEAVWICEGLPDALALHGISSEDHCAVSGKMVLPLKVPIRIIPDNDSAGTELAKLRAEEASRHSPDVKIVNLPACGEGKDLRDWILDGGTFEELHAAASESPQAAEGLKPVVENFKLVGEGKDAEKVAREHGEIANDIFSACEGWPRSIDSVLSAPGKDLPSIPEKNAVRSLRTIHDLFGWIKEACRVEWVASCRGGEPLTRLEFLSYLRDNPAVRYDGISYLPHSPAIPDLYYVPTDLPGSTGKALAGFVAAFNPESELDRDLLLAALLTPGWGGLPGQRPAFVFTSAHGRGAGKTTTAEVISKVWGGSITTDLSRKSLDEFKARLLDQTSQSKRIVLVDNIKTSVSNPQIEAMITSSVLDGKRMYHGDFRRPNLLTWFLTANSPRLSRDLTDRSVPVRIGKPKGRDFQGWAAKFLAARRGELLADLLAILESPDKCTIPDDRLGRWGAWQKAILQKFENGNDLNDLIISSRPAYDEDAEDAETVAEIVSGFLECHSIGGITIDPRKDKIGIPNRLLYEILRDSWSRPGMSDKSVRLELGNLISMEGLECLSPGAGRKFGRCHIWEGIDAEQSQPTFFPWSDSWQQKHKQSLSQVREWEG